MKLRLTLRSCPPAQGADTQRHLATGQLVIGRSAEADWCLRDQEKVLSKKHCVIEFKGGVYIVIDTSTNGVFHNESEKPVGRGNSVVLSDGDRLRFGAFVVKAEFVDDAPIPAGADPFLAVLRESEMRPAAPEGEPDDDDPFGPPGAAAAIPWTQTRIPDDIDDGDDGPLLPPKPVLDPFAAEAEWQRETPDWEPSTDAENDGGMETAAWHAPRVAAPAIPDDWGPDSPEEDVAPFGGVDAPVEAAHLPVAVPIGEPTGIPDDWLEGGDDDSPPAPPAFTGDLAASDGAEAPAAFGSAGLDDEMARLVSQAGRAALSLGAEWPPAGCLDNGEAVARHMTALLEAARTALLAAGVTVDQLEEAYAKKLSEPAEWS